MPKESDMDRELPDKHGVHRAMYDERSFSRDAIRELPELASELKSDEAILHVQVGTLGRVVREEIERKDLQLSPRIFAFLDRALAEPRAISEIANAIAISFVELDELQKTDAGRRAVEMMPPRLKACVAQGI